MIKWILLASVVVGAVLIFSNVSANGPLVAEFNSNGMDIGAYKSESGQTFQHAGGMQGLDLIWGGKVNFKGSCGNTMPKYRVLDSTGLPDLQAAEGSFVWASRQGLQSTGLVQLGFGQGLEFIMRPDAYNQMSSVSLVHNGGQVINLSTPIGADHVFTVAYKDGLQSISVDGQPEVTSTAALSGPVTETFLNVCGGSTSQVALYLDYIRFTGATVVPPPATLVPPPTTLVPPPATLVPPPTTTTMSDADVDAKIAAATDAIIIEITKNNLAQQDIDAAQDQTAFGKAIELQEHSDELRDVSHRLGWLERTVNKIMDFLDKFAGFFRRK